MVEGSAWWISFVFVTLYVLNIRRYGDRYFQFTGISWRSNENRIMSLLVGASIKAQLHAYGTDFNKHETAIALTLRTSGQSKVKNRCTAALMLSGVGTVVWTRLLLITSNI